MFNVLLNLFKSLFIAILAALFFLSCGGEKTDYSKKIEDALRTQERTPHAVLVDLLSFLSDKVENGGDGLEKTYNNEVTNIKSMIMRHDLEINTVKNYLSSLTNISSLQDKASTLSNQLMKTPDFNVLWQAYYGRVFDSLFVNELVKNPPPEVQTAITELGKGLGELLDREVNNPNLYLKWPLELKVKELVTKIDPRFWFPKVKVLEEIQKNDDGEVGSVNSIIEYLKKPKTNGYEVISIPYLVVKLGIKLGELNRRPKFLQESNKAFKRLDQLVTGIRVNLPDKKSRLFQPILTRVAGITLIEQPPVISEDWMVPSQRPSITRFPRIFPDPTKPKSYLLAKKALENWLTHGVVWISGMSGSTNMDLHAVNWLNTAAPPYKKIIDNKAAFLGIIMFLVYDGGHSIAETLWAAHSIDNPAIINLGFNLSSEGDIEKFLPDFERFRALYKGTPLEGPVERAFEKAFEGTIEHFRRTSLYRDPIWEKKYPINEKDKKINQGT